MVVGDYGSGKTEVAVHLARRWARQGLQVSLADLDLVNPYFRSREARAFLENEGVRVVAPEPKMEWSDLPIVMPEVMGLLHPAAGQCSIFDVGGDDVGSRVLASLRCALGASPYELWFVVNASRPFTNSVGGCLRAIEAIESASRLKTTGLVANTHLMEHTDARVVYDGYALARDVAHACDLPLRCAMVPAAFLDDPLLDAIETPRLPLRRTMLPPWKRKGRNLGSHPH
jgi:hypothetical protein